MQLAPPPSAPRTGRQRCLEEDAGCSGPCSGGAEGHPDSVWPSAGHGICALQCMRVQAALQSTVCLCTCAAGQAPTLPVSCCTHARAIRPPFLSVCRAFDTEAAGSSYATGCVCCRPTAACAATWLGSGTCTCNWKLEAARHHPLIWTPPSAGLWWTRLGASS